jgi:hypothetical protein
VNLLDAPHRHRPDLDECNLAEVARLQNIHLPMISKENVLLMKKGMPIDSPQWTTDPGAIEGYAIVRIMVMVIIYGRKSREHDRPTEKGLCTSGAAKDPFGA